jgi:hypothetical protein
VGVRRPAVPGAFNAVFSRLDLVRFTQREAVLAPIPARVASSPVAPLRRVRLTLNWFQRLRTLMAPVASK